MANGGQQDREVYDNASSPTPSIPAFFSIFAIAAKEGRYVLSSNIGDANLEKEPMYMRLC